MNTAIIISLGVSLVFCALIYFFLRKKVDSVDKKVNLLMQLVKEHHNQVQQQSQIIMREKNSSDSDHLIAVSDNEDEDDYAGEDYDSDDSMEISDSEDNDINVSPKTENITLESISLSGAETYTHLNELDTKTLSFEEINSPVVKVKMSNDIQLDEISLDEKGISDEEGEDDDQNDDQDDDQNDDQDDDQNDDQDDDQDNDQESEEKKELLEVIKENTDDIAAIIELEKNEDVATLRVKDLKLKAKEMGLEGYKKLKKQQLISLIVSHKESIGA